jgi:hypothetical protein
VNAPYIPLLKKLCGRPVMVEIADPSRQAVEVLKGHFWDLFFEDTLALFIVFDDENVSKSSEVQKQEAEDYKNKIAALALNPNLPKPTPTVPVFVVREFHLKWVRTANIIMVKSDAHVRINCNTRQMTRPKLDPLYTDNQPQWHVLNNAVSRQVYAKLEELGVKSAFEGIYRNEQNEPITKAQATPAPVAVLANAVPIGVVPPVQQPVEVPVQAGPVNAVF